MDLVGGLAAASQAITIAKAARDSEKAFDAATFRGQMADLLDKLTDAKLALTDAKEQLATQTAEIERLKNSFEERTTLVVAEEDYKFRATEHGAPIGYPICPACEVKTGRLVQLKRHGRYWKAKCPGCESQFEPVPSYVVIAGSKETETVHAVEARLAAERDRRNSAAIARAGSWLD